MRYALRPRKGTESPAARPHSVALALEQPIVAEALRQAKQDEPSGLPSVSRERRKGGPQTPLTRGLRKAADRAAAVSIERDCERLHELRR